MPPNYEIIPEPGSISKVQEKEEEKIQKILKAPTTDGISENNSSSIEDSILNRIRKWLIKIFSLKIIFHQETLKIIL